MALFGHPLLFFVLCLSICPQPAGSHFQHPTPASLAKRQPFPAELATLPHRPWAPKPSEPSISGFSSTKSAFLCAFCLRNPRFGAFRAQNRDFCALLPSETPIFRHFEHKIGIFVSETAIFPWFWPLPSTKSAFLCSRGGESGIRKRNRGDAYPSCKSPRTLPKCKYLITKQLTFAVVLGEHKLVAPSTLPLARSACGGTQRGR